MQCTQARELFSDHVAGQLDAPLSMSMENHIRTCEVCHAEVAGLRRVWASLEALPVVEPPAFFHENLMHRIGTEQDKIAEAAQRSGWNWRSLFLPRSPVFAGAAMAVLALFGMGSLHSQHASLDPIGAIWRLVSPAKPSSASAPSLQSARAQWRPNGQGGGTLTISAQAQAGAAISIRALNYRIGSHKLVAEQNDVALSAEHETTIVVSLEQRPGSDITLTLGTADGEKATVPVTLMEPVSIPAGER